MPQYQKLTIDQALSRAKMAVKKGDTGVALKLYNAILQTQPNNPVAKKELQKLQTKLQKNQFVQSLKHNPSHDQINILINCYRSGQLRKTEQICLELLQTYPCSSILFNMLGAALQGQGKLQEAVKSFDNAIKLKPDFAQAYNN